MLLIEQRASAVLYKFLVSNGFAKPFILPANICPIVPTTFLKARVPFELIDIDSASLCLAEEPALEKIRGRPTAYSGLLFGQTYGLKRSPYEFFAAVKRLDPRLILIDDRCCSPPEISIDEYGMQYTDLVLFSTGYGKHVELDFGGFGFMGDGYKYDSSIVPPYSSKDLTNLINIQKDVLNLTKAYRYEDSNWLDCTPPSMSSGEFLQIVQSRLRDVENHKAQLNFIYSTRIPEEFQYAAQFQNWRFNIKVSNKAVTLARIFQEGLFASSLYHSLGENVFVGEHYPVAVDVHRTTVNLFNDFHLTEEQAMRICEIVRKFAR